MINLISALFLLYAGVSHALPQKCEHRECSSTSQQLLETLESDINIFFFSRNIKDGQHIPHSDYNESVSHTDYDPSKHTIFTVHGWHNEETSPFSMIMKDGYLATADVNVFVIDWHSIAGQLYIQALAAVPELGTILGRLIESLMDNHSLDLNKTLVVGHSLGAHVAGITGATLNGSINTIIGLDPAGPGFSEKDLSSRLDPSDAQFVQAVHSCAGLLGVNYDVGHADYYANDGRNQPGCFFDIFGICAHGRVYSYFGESLVNGNFSARKCDSAEKFKRGECTNDTTSMMGQYNLDRSASGRYYFETNKKPPYLNLP